MDKPTTLGDVLACLGTKDSKRPCDVATQFPNETEEVVRRGLDHLVDAGLAERQVHQGVPHYLRKETS